MTALAPPTPLDRLKLSLRLLVREVFPALRFLGTYEYVVDSTSNGTCTGRPTDATHGLPPMTKWPMRACGCGGTATPTTGNNCLVTFVNGDPSRPIVVNLDAVVSKAVLDANDEVDVGPSASTVALAGGGPAIAGVGDTILAYLPNPCPISGTLAGAPFVGTIAVPGPLIGSIQTGSSKATRGT